MAALDLLDPAFVAVYDDLPLWSAAPGLLLLEEVPLAPGVRALDVGCGTGFPLVELAERIGEGGEVHGIDPWGPAVERARDKIARRGVRNAFVHEGSAETLPFEDASFDLIVSNLGVNNFADPLAVLRECRRVARPGAHVAIATNVQGSFAELYADLEGALTDVGVAGARERVAEHVATRTTIPRTQVMLAHTGFAPVRSAERSFRMRWASAAALLEHSFVRLAFRPAWEALFPEDSREAGLAALARRLDERARQTGALELTVPLACVIARAA
jgi:arsenite methyltransferase